MEREREDDYLLHGLAYLGNDELDERSVALTLKRLRGQVVNGKRFETAGPDQWRVACVDAAAQ
jgi:hypothetical protein